jgi:hypothetical protein
MNKLSVFGIVSVISVLMMLMLRAGFCVERKAFISDDELCDSAIEEVLKVYPGQVQRKAVDGTGREYLKHYRPASVVPYQGSSQFKSLNPSACKLVKRSRLDGRAPTNISRITGDSSYIVRVSYVVREIGQDGLVDAYSQDREIWLDRCGNLAKYVATSKASSENFFC